MSYGRHMTGRADIVSGRADIVSGADAADLHELMGTGYYATGEDDHHGHGPAGPAAYTRGQRLKVVDRAPTRERAFPIGFTSPTGTPVPANGNQLITVQPQVIFRSERLAVPNSIVLNFQLADIKVGKDSQLAAPGNLPTECFSNISIGVRMQLDTSEPGITVSLLVVNTDANNTHPFASVLYGTVVE